MNPCCKLSLIDGARYIAIIEFVFSTLAITVISLQFINNSQHGLAINNDNVSLSSTYLTQVSLMYMVISGANFVHSLLLYKGIRTDNLKLCRAILIISFLSAIFGIVIVTYHGFHLANLDLTFFNLEFFIMLTYHLFKLYGLIVVGAFVVELDKLMSDVEGNGTNRRFQYQSLEPDPAAENAKGERAQYVVFNMTFGTRHYIPEDKFKIDYESCMEYDETTSTLYGMYEPYEGSKRPVAVKILKSNFRKEKPMIELVKEAKLLSYIEHHEHILLFLGICCTSTETCRGNVMLIMETYPALRVDEFLQTSYDDQLRNFQNLLVNDQNPFERRRNIASRRLGTVYENYGSYDYDLEAFSTINMIQWAYQLGSAMEYLHSKKVIVGNLQAKSLILIKISRVKLSNFGFASELHNENNTITSIHLSGKISWRWTALECLASANKGLPTEFNEKSDIWSYASTLWEIFCMGHAPNMSSTLPDHIRALERGERLEKPKFASDGVYNIMRTCWSHNPLDRPGFNVITLFFRQLLSKSIGDIGFEGK